MGVYFVFVLGHRYTLRRYMKTSTDYFFRPLDPAWVAGLAFLSAIWRTGGHRMRPRAPSTHGDQPLLLVGAIPAMCFSASS